MISKIKKFVKYFSLPAFLLLPLITLAQTTGGVGSGLDRIGGAFPHTGISGAETASDLIVYIIRILLLFAGMIAVVFIIIGGYFYVTSAGNEEQAEKGKTTLVNAIIGVVIIIMSWVIISVVTNLVGNNAI